MNLELLQDYEDIEKHEVYEESVEIIEEPEEQSIKELYSADLKTLEEYEDDTQFSESQIAKANQKISKFSRTKAISKVGNYTFTGELGATPTELRTERVGNKTQLTVKACINYSELDGITVLGKKELTPYDRIVHDSVVSLYISGKKIISPLMILKIMTGNPSVKLNPTQEEAINNSMQKLRHTVIKIDATEEVEAYHMDKDIWEDNVLCCSSRTIGYDGKPETAWYQINKIPALYEYAKQKKQLIEIPAILSNTPINKNKELLVIQDYLYQRINAMKSNKKLNKSILYNTIYDYIDIAETNQSSLDTKKFKIRKQIKTILDHWCENKFISGYHETKQGNEIHSVVINI